MRLSLRGLVVEYRGPDGEALSALGPLTLNIESGSFVALLGPSGSGKSTLVRALAGLIAPTRGEIRVGDVPVAGPSAAVGLMFQDANLMPWRTVEDNIALPLELRGVAREARRASAAAMLPMLGLEGFARAYPGELSGGMAQRAALGRVLIHRPAVLLLDEPFGALDAMTREQISFDLLAIWGAERQTILMVTHDVNEAVLLADRVLVLTRRPGQIAADVPVPLGRPRRLEDVYSDSFGATARRVRAALGGG